jgi:hypothetical protein
VEEVAAVVATADRNQKIVMLILALNISGRWIFEALGYWMRCASSLLVCNIIPKYPILVIDSSHDLKVNRCGSVHITTLYLCLGIAISKFDVPILFHATI